MSKSKVPLLPLAAHAANDDGEIGAPRITRSASSPRRRVALYFDPKEDRTQQSYKDDCDINLIMQRYLRTGVLPSSDRQPVYLDTTAYDFLEAQNLVARARGEFSLLPADERDKYGNQVELWLDDKARQAAEAAEEVSRAAEAAKVAPAAPTPHVEAPPKAEAAAPGKPKGAS